jgi:transcriptional antiterminator RfaH
MSFWGCCQLIPFKTNLALNHLRTIGGYEVFFPRLREWRRNHGRRQEHITGLFPNYCFVLVTQMWTPICRTPGVANLVRYAGVPAKVPDATIAAIRMRENAEGLVSLERPLRIGDKVRIVAGPFDGHVGTLDAAMNGNERTLVLLQLFGAERRVLVPTDRIERAE